MLHLAITMENKVGHSPHVIFFRRYPLSPNLVSSIPPTVARRVGPRSFLYAPRAGTRGLSLPRAHRSLQRVLREPYATAKRALCAHPWDVVGAPSAGTHPAWDSRRRAFCPHSAPRKHEQWQKSPPHQFNPSEHTLHGLSPLVAQYWLFCRATECCCTKIDN